MIGNRYYCYKLNVVVRLTNSCGVCMCECVWVIRRKQFLWKIHGTEWGGLLPGNVRFRW